VDAVRRSLDVGLKLQVVERSLVPTMLFTEHDLVVAVGQDGLVANTAKYVGEQPIVAVNPDPERFDGILLRYSPAETRGAVTALLDGRAKVRKVTLAEAALDDGQRLLAFNDLFIGARSHVSARYRIAFGRARSPIRRAACWSPRARARRLALLGVRHVGRRLPVRRRPGGQGHSARMGGSAAGLRRARALREPPLQGGHRRRDDRVDG
jgi:hypothetical protein